MRTRREFLSDMAGTTAGIALAGAGVTRAARREVILGGRRVRVVDGHAHCAMPEVLEVVKGTELESAFRTAQDACVRTGSLVRTRARAAARRNRRGTFRQSVFQRA